MNHLRLIHPGAANQRCRAGAGAITPDEALRLARYFDTTAQFRLKLQTAFDLKQAESTSAEQFAEEVPPL
jgi:plasmid maintenance system antidote protein VapI